MKTYGVRRPINLRGHGYYLAVSEQTELWCDLHIYRVKIGFQMSLMKLKICFSIYSYYLLEQITVVIILCFCKNYFLVFNAKIFLLNWKINQNLLHCWQDKFYKFKNLF